MIDVGDIVVHLRQEQDQRRVRLSLPSGDDDALRCALEVLVQLTADASTLHGFEGVVSASGSAQDVVKALAVVSCGTYELSVMEHTFETPDGIESERRVFERLAQCEGTAERAAQYAHQLNPRRIGQGVSRYLPCRWHDAGYPAGCFAVIPYALHHPRHIPMLVAHLEGCDPNADTFHSRLLRVLWDRHGWCDEMVDLLARRATYLCGQAGQRDLHDAAISGQLTEHLLASGKVEEFVRRLGEYAALGSTSAQTQGEWVRDAVELLYLEEPDRRAAFRAQEADMNERFPQRDRWRSLAPEDWDDVNVT